MVPGSEESHKGSRDVVPTGGVTLNCPHVEYRLGPPGWHVPVRFGWQDAMRDVVEVIDRWSGTGHCYTRLRGSDGNQYILRHNELDDRWEIVYFEQPLVPGGDGTPSETTRLS